MNNLDCESRNNIKQIGGIILGSVLGGLVGSVITYSLISNETFKNVGNRGTNGSTEYKIQDVENPVSAIAKEVSPSIVGIKVKSVQEGFFGTLQESEGEGSGIIYSKDGYIITNYHVVEEAIKNSQSTVEVYLANDKDSLSATVIGGDSVTDLAVIKVDKVEGKTFIPAKLGESKEVDVGDIAVAIGNPLGLEFAGTVTGGYISGVDRTITADGRSYKLMQTDAAINAGNSGGALVNSKGEIIGINSAKINATGVEGIGFAIPIDDAKPIIEELIANKKIKRPYIGIAGIEIDKETAKRYEYPEGIYVKTVEKGSPAEQAGVKVGDIIVKVENKKISKMDELNARKFEMKIGDKLKITVSRATKETELEIVLGEAD
ncbi:MAG: trypsin-like peptidase domain-containing protein [Clostridia bacterium]